MQRLITFGFVSSSRFVTRVTPVVYPLAVSHLHTYITPSTQKVLPFPPFVHIDDSVVPSSPNMSKVDELYSTMIEAKDPHNRKEHLKKEHADKKKKDKKKKDSTPTDAAQSSTPTKGEQQKAEQSKKGKK
ncbi:hypothetical protein AV274_2333 [Blastocystis sp. ATCC 50177/Nand II]|uniref:Uncharacterized protein n=1 Tax=Blastocystis sp. subtype 1 (strain ATCC 50177 / NandII) TaxID=478820 RepID=A0A196SJ07_BLAHN|nr:hypothetical protein AV274_2333 [Blastocystis sp. ATCC 50177/Nand II]